MRQFFLFAVVAVLSACAGITRGVVEDPKMTTQLAFLNGSNVSRASVEARLGAPSASYEGGTVVSYGLYTGTDTVYNDDLLKTTPNVWGPPRYALLLQYDPNGQLVRYVLIRRRQ
jgi:hypothetical protein